MEITKFDGIVMWQEFASGTVGTGKHKQKFSLGQMFPAPFVRFQLEDKVYAIRLSSLVNDILKDLPSDAEPAATDIKSSKSKHK